MTSVKKTHDIFNILTTFKFTYVTLITYINHIDTLYKTMIEAPPNGG